MDMDRETYDIGLSKAHAISMSCDFYLAQIGDRERWDVYVTETDELIGSSERLRGVGKVVETWLDQNPGRVKA
jgi:hypothetical protein